MAKPVKTPTVSTDAPTTDAATTPADAATAPAVSEDKGEKYQFQADRKLIDRTEALKGIVEGKLMYGLKLREADFFRAVFVKGLDAIEAEQAKK